MIKMLQIGMTVKVLPDAEYGGKYTGCVGVVKNYYCVPDFSQKGH